MKIRSTLNKSGLVIFETEHEAAFSNSIGILSGQIAQVAYLFKQKGQ
jgi:hypothetical protein